MRKSYIGETGRKLETRINEHKASLRRGDPEISKLTEHSVTLEHRFKFEETKVIGKEPNWRRRKVHEAGEILKGGEKVISTPSFEIYKVWHTLIKDTRIRKKWKNNDHMPLRRSMRLKLRAEQNSVTTASSRVLRSSRRGAQ
jgi:hypothetical protein